jgi:hypothetical protein
VSQQKSKKPESTLDVWGRICAVSGCRGSGRCVRACRTTADRAKQPRSWSPARNPTGSTEFRVMASPRNSSTSFWRCRTTPARCATSRSRRDSSSTWTMITRAAGAIVRRVHPRTPVPYLQHRARPHRTPICDGSRLPGQPSRPAPRRRLAFNQESPCDEAGAACLDQSGVIGGTIGPEHPGRKVSDHSTYEPPLN